MFQQQAGFSQFFSQDYGVIENSVFRIFLRNLLIGEFESHPILMVCLQTITILIISPFICSKFHQFHGYLYG